MICCCLNHLILITSGTVDFFLSPPLDISASEHFTCLLKFQASLCCPVLSAFLALATVDFMVEVSLLCSSVSEDILVVEKPRSS